MIFHGTRMINKQEHWFYVNEAKSRLLPPFSDIHTEASECYAKQLAKRPFNPEYDCFSSFSDEARELAMREFELLVEMKKQVKLSIVAGMYFRWEKALKDWLVIEFTKTQCLKQKKKAIYKATSSQLIKLFEMNGWDTKEERFSDSFYAMLLIVNVFKHGNGASLLQLKKDFPNFVKDPIRKFEGPIVDLILSGEEYVDHSFLDINEKNIDDFATSISEFWEAIPEKIFYKKLPKWVFE